MDHEERVTTRGGLLGNARTEGASFSTPFHAFTVTVPASPWVGPMGVLAMGAHRSNDPRTF